MLTVSVILTTYNSEAVIQRTLNSIFNQTNINRDFKIQLIIVDDCSNDHTVGILKENKLNYFSTKINSGGPNKGRNIGLDAASGDYICFIDHDDTWEPDKIKLQLKLIRNYPIVSTGYRIIYHASNRMVNRHKNSITPVIYGINETFLHKLSHEKGGQNCYLSTLMIRHDLKNILFEERFGCTDYDWILRIFENRESAEIPACLMKKYIHGTNLSLNNEYRKSDYYYSLYTIEAYEDKYPRECKKGMKRINGSRARYLYLCNKMKHSRKYLRKSSMDIKNLTFFLTSIAGYNIIRKRVHFFG